MLNSRTLQVALWFLTRVFQIVLARRPAMMPDQAGREEAARTGQGLVSSPPFVPHRWADRADPDEGRL